MLEEHTIHEPGWIRTLIEDVVVAAVQPLGFIGPLGYRWWDPDNADNQFDGWQIAVFPTPNEVRGATEHDGSKYVSGFLFDVGKVIEMLTSVKNVVWRSPVQYNGDLDGPELSLQGQFAGKNVWLRFFHLPPADEPCSWCVNPTTGAAWERPA